MELSDILVQRSSIRKFKTTEVPDEILDNLVAAACYAPSTENTQPWRFIIVKSTTYKDKLKVESIPSFTYNAPAIIVCCGDTTQQPKTEHSKIFHDLVTYSEDSVNIESTPTELRLDENNHEKDTISYLETNMPIAITYLLLKAVDLGLGACYVEDFDEDLVRNAFSIDPRYKISALVPIGYPDQESSSAPNLELNEVVINRL